MQVNSFFVFHATNQNEDSVCFFLLSVIQKQESLSPLTALMQEPGSPQVKQPLMTREGDKELAQLISYSIVIDVKSTV